MNKKIGIYPGTFDPITNGHLDIIKRGLKIFDVLYVVVPINILKNTLFSVDERITLLKEVLKDYDNVIVDSTDKLTVEYAKSVGAFAMLRGLRMMSDFEYELQLSAINKVMNDNIETIFVMSSYDLSFISSSTIKEMTRFGGDISSFVPDVVKKALNDKFKN